MSNIPKMGHLPTPAECWQNSDEPVITSWFLPEVWYFTMWNQPFCGYQNDSKWMFLGISNQLHGHHFWKNSAGRRQEVGFSNVPKGWPIKVDESIGSFFGQWQSLDELSSLNLLYISASKKKQKKLPMVVIPQDCSAALWFILRCGSSMVFPMVTGNFWGNIPTVHALNQ